MIKLKLARRQFLTRAQQKVQQTKRQIWLTRLSLVAAVLLIIFLLGRLIGFINQGRLPKKGRLTLGWGSQPAVLTSLSPRERELTFLVIPGNTLVESLYGYGFYRIEAFGKLSQLEKQPFLFQESLSDYFSLPINGWLDHSRSLPEEMEARALKKWVRQGLLTSWRQKQTGNLNAYDLWRWWWLSWSVPVTRIKVITLEEGFGLAKLELPDGSFVMSVDLEKTDVLIQEFFADPQIKKENLTVGVANATNHAGLASRAARKLINLGAKVVTVKDWEQFLPTSELRVSSEKMKTVTAQKISQALNLPLKEGETGQFFVDLLLVVGEDYWQRLTKR